MVVIIRTQIVMHELQYISEILDLKASRYHMTSIYICTFTFKNPQWNYSSIKTIQKHFTVMLCFCCHCKRKSLRNLYLSCSLHGLVIIGIKEHLILLGKCCKRHCLLILLEFLYFFLSVP